MSIKHRFKILIADDEKSNIDVLNHILKDKYTIYAAKNGYNAIKTAKEHSPDLILLDIIMPDISGFDVLAELKKYELTMDIPVIFITGLDNLEDEERGLNLGAVDYITKPFHLSIVKARVGTHLKLVEQMRKIEHLSMTDELTDIPNRRYFNDQLKREWGRAIREKTPISILMIDVDRFKLYNDRYGHPQGDAALQGVADIFKKALKRSTDFVARWGGEEFVVLLPGVGAKIASMLAETIRANVEKLVVPLADGTPTRITVSIGINSENPIAGRPFSGFVMGADEALYAAKNTGRNKVCVFTEKRV